MATAIKLPDYQGERHARPQLRLVPAERRNQMVATWVVADGRLTAVWRQAER